MDWTLIIIAVFAIFIPALMLPGPDFIAVVRMAMTRGVTAGLLTTLGVTLGLGFYASLSLLGLSAVLVEYQWLAVVIRVLGGCYLAYLGVRLLFPRPDPADMDMNAKPGGNPFLFGILVTLTNPKAVVLFASVFATASSGPMPFGLMALMVGLVMVSSLTWYTLISLSMASGPVMRRFQAIRHWIERAAGVCFVAIGGRILADARNPISP